MKSTSRIGIRLNAALIALCLGMVFCAPNVSMARQAPTSPPPSTLTSATVRAPSENIGTIVSFYYWVRSLLGL